MGAIKIAKMQYIEEFVNPGTQKTGVTDLENTVIIPICKKNLKLLYHENR